MTDVDSSPRTVRLHEFQLRVSDRGGGCLLDEGITTDEVRMAGET